MSTTTDGPGFDSAAPDSDFVFLTLSRREVESGNISDALDRLLNLSDNAAHLAKFEDSLALAYTGWDSDARELHEIPQVVSYFRKLTDHWPYWFHFIEKDSPANTMGMLFWLLCDVEVVRVQGGMVGFSFTQPEQVGITLRRLFDGMNALYENNGIDEAQNEAMSQKVMAAFDKAIPTS